MSFGILILAFSVLLSSACGAPSKSASEVAGIFTSSVSLDVKVANLCKSLTERTLAPSFSGTSFKDTDCKNPGQSAINLKDSTTLFLQGLDSISSPSDQVVRSSIRSEIWLNRSLIALASTVGKAMSTFENSGTNIPNGNITPLLGPSIGPLANLAVPSITIINPLKFDMSNLAFSGTIRITINGIVKANNDIQISGKVIDEKIAIIISTTADKSYEQSLLKRFEAAILIVPHVNDIYLDTLINLDINDPGIGNDALRKQVHDIIESGLGAIIGGIFKL